MIKHYTDKEGNLYKEEITEKGKTWWSKKINNEWFVLSGKPSAVVTLFGG